jgi:hypothetical protein
MKMRNVFRIIKYLVTDFLCHTLLLLSHCYLFGKMSSINIWYIFEKRGDG